MATGTVQCPTCGGQFSVDSSMAMQNVRCPHCGESIYLEGFESGQEETPEGRGNRSKENPASSGRTGSPSTIDSQFRNNSRYQTPQRSMPLQALDQVPKERSRVFLHTLLVAIVAILVFLCTQLFRLCEHMSKVNDKLESVNGKLYDVKDKLVDVDNKLGKSNRIVGYKLIDYTWEYSALMENEFRTAIEAGYEPVGYVCQNSIKGGFFLFVKRAK